MPYTLHPDDWEPQGVDSVESNARKVIRSRNNASVVAGPGSGKTELLAQRASYLLQTGFCPAPRRILAISFKTDAARNLKERVASRCDPKLAQRFDSRTFDAFNLTTLLRCREALPAWCRPSPNFEPYTRGWRQELKDYLQNPPGISRGTQTYNRLQQVEAENFYREYVLETIPESGFSKGTIREKLAFLWWRELLESGPSRLTFPMIARLTEFLFRNCPELNNALRSTYSHVFLDEFQDITFWQYDFLETAFRDTDAVLTAVGDHRQSIMGWAGAIPEPFKDFESDFSATSESLISNYRSTPELVDFQHNLAQLLDPNSQKANSKKSGQVNGDVCRVWRFSTEGQEADKVAEYIRNEKQKGDLRGDDFAVIVKQKSANFTESLRPSFESRGLKIRDESQIQELLSENLTDMFLSFLRLGCSGSSSTPWRECCDFMEDLTVTGGTEDQAESKRIRNDLSEFRDTLRGVMGQGVPVSEHDLKRVLEVVLNFIYKHKIKKKFPEYRRDRDFKYWYSKLVEEMVPVLENHDNWKDALDEFEGIDVTPVMTIHKSKGLEYNTVFFLAFEDDSWWTMHSNRSNSQIEESMRAFFVGFSRAEQRVIFTNCDSRSNCQEVKWLYKRLDQAGARFEDFTT